MMSHSARATPPTEDLGSPKHASRGRWRTVRTKIGALQALQNQRELTPPPRPPSLPKPPGGARRVDACFLRLRVELVGGERLVVTLLQLKTPEPLAASAHCRVSFEADGAPFTSKLLAGRPSTYTEAHFVKLTVSLLCCVEDFDTAKQTLAFKLALANASNTSAAQVDILSMTEGVSCMAAPRTKQKAESEEASESGSLVHVETRIRASDAAGVRALTGVLGADAALLARVQAALAAVDLCECVSVTSPQAENGALLQFSEDYEDPNANSQKESGSEEPRNPIRKPARARDTSVSGCECSEAGAQAVFTLPSAKPGADGKAALMTMSSAVTRAALASAPCRRALVRL